MRDSVADWPRPVEAPEGAPNIIVILLDDIGFADASTFGGPARTPELTALAEGGLRFNNFNVTAMCSPTRASLLTGHNHHRVGFGIIADFAGGFPGYNSVWNPQTACVAEVLRRHGYSTAAFGKWHNTPDWEITPVGPFDRWPTGLGFEYFYGFMGPAGAENQWRPAKLYRNTVPVDPPSTPEQGYHLTTDITDEAIRWIETHDVLAPERPYFLYIAPGAVHSPHHAPREWIDRYRGEFDQGWDRLNEEIFERQKALGVIPPEAELTPRPDFIPAWDDLSAEQKRLYARQMEVYAGFVAHTDAELGRLLSAARSASGADNTLIMYVVGDNGAAGGVGLDGITSGASTVADQLARIDDLGGPSVPSNHYSDGWAWAGSTPFKWWKTFASHFGGLRNPLVVSWPARIRDDGGIRGQFTHVTDVVPTLYEAAGIAPPAMVNGIEQYPLEGTSLIPLFEQPDAASQHHTQYFELFGNRSIYHDGWIASARHLPAQGWWREPGVLAEGHELDAWELYHVAGDFSQARDVADQYPDKLRELQALFDAEARRNQVYPLGAAFGAGKPAFATDRTLFVYPGSMRAPTGILPPFLSSSFSLTADLLVSESGGAASIASYEDGPTGFVLYVEDGCPIFESRDGTHSHTIAANTPLPTGDVILRVDVDWNDREVPATGMHAAGSASLHVDGECIGTGELRFSTPSIDTALLVGSPPGRLAISTPISVRRLRAELR